jgi:GNAT superfamily N-acetyltransferase
VSVELRPARADEADRLMEIQRDASVAAFAHIFPPDRYPFPEAPVRELWADALAAPETDVLVAARDGHALGVVSLSPGWLQGLYVDPSAQGEGVGSQLHDEALARRAAAGDSSLRLWTLEGNEGARRFYERRGWRLDGNTRVVPFPPHPLDVGYSFDLRMRPC